MLLRHEQSSSASSYTPASRPTEATTDTSNISAAEEDLLEDAVDQACAPLIGTLPRQERLARRNALRQELDTLVAAHGELEATPERVLSEALAHFARLHPVPTLHGTQGHVQQTVAQQTASTRGPSSAWPATLLALGLLVPVYIAHVLHWTETLREALHLSEPGLYRLELFAAPLLAGLFVGLLTRSQAVRGVFIACAALALYTVGLPSLLSALSVMGLRDLPNSPFWSWLGIDPLAGYDGLVLWPLLGCAGAFAGAAIRRKALF